MPAAVYDLWVDHAIDHFGDRPGVDVVLLVGSAARGKAVKDVDLAILVRPKNPRTGPAHDEWSDPNMRKLHDDWLADVTRTEVEREIGGLGPDSHVDIGFTDGCFAPEGRGWTSWPEAFELEIGNGGKRLTL